MQPGDVLIAFTDGISEAMNLADEEWGEDRLISQAWKTGSLNAEGTMRHIVASVDEFVGTAKQHDDMTIIVARIQ